ncbi:TonB-dependent receptor [Psychromarinibacter sp. C21-152]|uniref:TonB-dependent receptor n=1 Tax=Psychromarinibacter sediminicola TaxID=3033385 RepID=A0AAE3NS49_9RHOB|nr:TonB-dependent receptor [Psychromarinibacter sediminicola]MDF0603288.1 TonB-dependent receptor [Psychromarinibacter sediminicola]
MCTTAASAAMLAGPVAAQDGFTRLGRIVLGFGGSESVAIDTPQAVTVLDQADIDREQATTVAELFDTVPGIQGIGSERVGGVSFNIRGVGELAASDESKIIVTVDGATKFYEQYRMGSFFSDPELYKQVEVLRGPASSTLYGSGAIGGVINFETKDAGDFITAGGTHALRFRGGYDSQGNEKLASAIYAFAPSEAFEAVFALNYRTAGNYEDGDGTEVPGSEFDAASGLLKAKYSFGDAYEHSLTASYSVWDSKADDTQYSQTGTLGAFGTIDRDIHDETLALRYEYPASDTPWIDLDVVLSYSDTNVVQEDASAPIPSPLFADGEYAYRTASLKIENTFELSMGAWENYVTAGVQYSHQDRVAETSMGPLGFHPEGTDEKIGVYLQAEFIWNDTLTIVPGVRADFVSLTPGDMVGGSGFGETLVSPKLAAHYQLNDTYAIFGSVAHTQRVPTLDEIYSSDADEPNSPDLDMETANSVELGVSGSWQGIFTPNDAVEVKATGFWSEIDDMIARDSTAGTPYYRNIDAAEIWGLEVEGAYESDFAFGRLAVSDVRGEDKSTGETPTSIPQRSLVLTLGGKAPDVGVEYGWRGKFYDDIDYGGGDAYDGYVLHDLFLDWTPQRGPMQGVTFGVSVDNVFDTAYRNSLAGDNGPGRSIGVSITKAFEF